MTIKIFLASSIVELHDERIAIGDLFGRLDEAYFDKCGIRFELEKCEDYDDSIRTEGAQAQYDTDISNSDIVVFLFAKSVGEYTKHELEVAMENLKEKGSPKIYIFFKLDSSGAIAGEAESFSKELSDSQMSYSGFESMLELKIHILNIVVNYLKTHGKEEPYIDLRNGKLYVERNIIIDLRKASSEELELLDL